MGIPDSLSQFLGDHILWVSILVILTTIYICKSLMKQKLRLPPGPTGLPILGYSPFMEKVLHLQFTRMSKTYGQVFSIQLGSRYAVVLNSFKAIKEAFNKDDFSGRPPGLFNLLDDVNHIGSMSLKEWKETRRFTLSSLRTLGMGKNEVEEMIMGHVSTLMDSLAQSTGKPEVNVHDHLSGVITDTIISLICGRTVTQSQDFTTAVEITTKQLLEFWDINSRTFFLPILEPFKNMLYRRLKDVTKGVARMSNMLRKEIENHEKDIDDANLADYMDFFLAESTKRENQPSTFTKNTLIGNSHILLSAGNDTIRSTIEWAILNMVKYPDIQERAYQEIVQVLGKERPASWNDRESLPFVEAVILESYRLSSNVPLGVPHWTLTDTSVCNFDIPKDTYVFSNVHAVHMDPELWENPEEFDPNRFLTDNGTKCKAPEFLMPFAYGKRVCPGEKLASVSVFLFFASILQRFRMLPSSRGVNMDGEQLMGLFSAKNPFLKIENRD